MRTDAISFDITGYLFTDTVREMTICIDGKRVTISEAPLQGSDLWIVLSSSLERLLQDRFMSFYPMFFGVLLQELHDHKSLVPIRGIPLDDAERAFQQGGGQLNVLARKIAMGSYSLATDPSNVKNSASSE